MTTPHTIQVHVFLKPGVLDPQGVACLNAAQHFGLTAITAVNVGRLITLQITAPDRASALQTAEKLCAALLVNPVIEDYRIL